MFGGINPKQMEAAMKKMGIKTQAIEADEVIINGPKRIVIKKPQVTMMEMQGQKTFQIIGNVEETESEEKGASEEDVKLVMEKTGADENAARAALEKSNGDIAEAIMSLT